MEGTISDLDELIRNMKPVLSDKRYFIATVDPSALPSLFSSIGSILEVSRGEEGLSIVFEEDAMDSVRELTGKDIVGPFSRITLNVYSDLMSVGFLAKMASALAAQGISVNAFSPYHHDHLLVPYDKRSDAMAVLADLQEKERK